MFSKIILITILSVYCSAEEDITKGPPNYDKPWIPAWGYNKSDPTLWNKHHQDMIKQTELNRDKIKVVFFGDSKTYFWSEVGAKWWQQYYSQRGAYNYGIRGDSTRQILWRLEHKELDGLTPQLVVFMIGGNNFNNNYNKGTDDEIVKALIVIMQKLKEKLPHAKIIFVGQLPREGPNDKRAKDVNHLIQEHYNSDHDHVVHFVNFYDKFVNSDGTQNKQLFVSDGIHLSSDGYLLLAQSLEPTVKILLNETIVE